MKKVNENWKLQSKKETKYDNENFKMNDEWYEWW